MALVSKSNAVDREVVIAAQSVKLRLRGEPVYFSLLAAVGKPQQRIHMVRISASRLALLFR